MFQNAAIDVATALILMYLTLSLLCTVINEFIATKLKLRANSLASALEQLLDYQPLRDAFYGHGLIATNKSAAAVGPQSTLGGIARAARDVRRMISHPPAASPAAGAKPAAEAPAPAPQKDQHPSYLSSRSVALALIGSLDPKKPVPQIADIRKAVEDLPKSRIRDTLLSSLTEAGNDLDKLRTSIATWFDDSMERLSGAYKRQLKWISVLIGLIVAIAFNADSFNVAKTLWGDQDRRASIVAVATKAAEGSTASGVSQAIDSAKLQAEIKKAEDTLRSIPIGWNCGANGVWECANSKLGDVTLLQALGWILTAAALSLGAPFWFDLLQKFVNIRGAGGKPKREDEKATA